MADGLFRLPHIVLPDISHREGFKPPRGGGGGRVPSPVADREIHAQTLLAQNRAVLGNAMVAMARRANLLSAAQNGFYLRVESRLDQPLLAEKFELKRNKGVELLTVTEDPETQKTAASLFVPEQARDFLERTLETYRTELEPRAPQPKPMHRDLVEGIGGISLAVLRDLWTDPVRTFPPPGESIQWEAWFRPGTTDRFRAIAADHAVHVGAHPLVFPEDVAILLEGTPEQLAAAVEATISISRLARAKRSTAFILAAPPDEQRALMDELLGRTGTPQETNNTLCILDTGVNRAHPMLSRLLHEADCNAFDAAWGSGDHDGHGTRMAGVCAYGDIGELPAAPHEIAVPYRLESVKIYPQIGQNPHDLLGAITAGGVARAELTAPHRRRVYCLATSTDDDTPHRGRPTSWSAELDQLCSGAEEEHRVYRLICVSAGNIREQLAHSEYLDANDLAEVESPAQAWNALAVGAFTEKVDIVDPNYEGWTAFGNAGDLCPTSRTAAWANTWPVKPDIVLEGGNLGVDPADQLGYGVADLQLTTTSRDYPGAVFEGIGETSAATAGASRLAALIQNEYPNLWPETIRALIVSSANWTGAMLAHLPPHATKTDHGLLLKRYGFGVPDHERAMRSARNNLALIEEGTIQPFAKHPGHAPSLNEMKSFSLPWPTSALNDLGAVDVEMRVTLSYFIEPNPAESARGRKSRYASHGLRFAVKIADEHVEEFRKRINKAARTEDEAVPHVDDTGWVLGPVLRDRGSLHSDIWRGPATELARRGVIAVYPVGGWWKERLQQQRVNSSARFALVVTLATPGIDVDIYTPIANQIVIPVQAG
jgi:hypothetical protein